MTITDIRFAVHDGRCTWLQVYETLINAGTSHYTRRQFLDGKLDVAASVGIMLEQLLATGEVPLTLQDGLLTSGPV